MVSFTSVCSSTAHYCRLVYIHKPRLTAILFHPDLQMTLITIFLHSSYLGFIYVFVFLSTGMLSSRFLYTTSLVCGLGVLCRYYQFRVFKSFCTVEHRLTTANVINTTLEAGLIQLIAPSSWTSSSTTYSLLDGHQFSTTRSILILEPFICIVHFMLSRYFDYGLGFCMDLLQEAVVNSSSISNLTGMTSVNR
jgi:hypothetical protein